MIAFLTKAWPVIACGLLQWGQAVICLCNRNYPPALMFAFVGCANIASAWIV